MKELETDFILIDADQDIHTKALDVISELKKR